MPVSIVTLFTSATMELFLTAVSAGATETLIFELSSENMDKFSTSLSRELSLFGFDSSLIGVPNDDHEFEFVVSAMSGYVAVSPESKSVNGLKEYTLFYGNRPVTARLYFINTGTKDIWKPLDRKWYMIREH